MKRLIRQGFLFLFFFFFFLLNFVETQHLHIYTFLSTYNPIEVLSSKHKTVTNGRQNRWPPHEGCRGAYVIFEEDVWMEASTGDKA